MLEKLTISSTYMRLLLQSNAELKAKLTEAPHLKIDSLLSNDYLSCEVVAKTFDYIQSQGVESWLLRYGHDISVASHGPVGFAALSAPDLHTSLSVIADYSIVRCSFTTMDLNYTQNRAELRFKHNVQHPLSQRWVSENFIHSVANLIETITAHPIGDNAQILFTDDAPNYAKKLEELFGVQCRFKAPYTGISIPASWCGITSPLHDEHSFRSNLAKCRELKLKTNNADNLAYIVELYLQNYFEQRQININNASELPSLHHIARQQCLSPRTLNRRLNELNTSYREILEKVRQQLALSLLENTHLTASKISYYLAYQEPANFNRAFKRWFGISPAAWRTQ